MLFHGPPGTGKTSLVQLCVHDAGLKLFSIYGPELVSQYFGESARALYELFESACQASPAVVVFLPSLYVYTFYFQDYCHLLHLALYSSDALKIFMEIKFRSYLCTTTQKLKC